MNFVIQHKGYWTLDLEGLKRLFEKIPIVNNVGTYLIVKTVTTCKLALKDVSTFETQIISTKTKYSIKFKQWKF